MLNHDPQNQLYQRQAFFGIAVQEAVIPDPTKALGQDMLQHQPQEVLTLEGAVQGPARLAFEIPEGHLAVAIGNDVVFTDHAAVQVTRQVFQSGFTFADMLAVDYPLIWQLTGMVSPAAFIAARKRARNTLARANSLNRYLPFFFFHCRLA